MEEKPYWVIGCISHDGAIVGRPYPDPTKNMFSDNSSHTAAESCGKRWRWDIPHQEFMETLQDTRRRGGLQTLDGLTKEEILLVVDWLVRNGHATDETYLDFAHDE